MRTIFKISRGYRSLTMYRGNDCGKLISTSTITPMAKLSRREKYDELKRHVDGIFGEKLGIKMPEYIPTKGES